MYQFAAIPELLTSRNRWLNWQTVLRPGAAKPTKIPLNPMTGQLADVMDPSTWGTFAQACANVAAGRVEGIGFVLGGGIAGIDLDDPNGDPDRLRVYGEIMSRFATYQEISPSGKGLHVIFTHNDGAEGGKRRGGVEFYYSKRFLTFTGNVWNGMNEVRDCTAYGSILFEQMGGGEASADSGVDEAQTDDDQTVINRAASAANGNDFRSLWAGQRLHHPSQSEADQHLMNIIAFYTNNRDQAIRVFCASGLGATLSRKGNPADYLRRTVSKAFDQKLDASHYEQTARDLAELLKLDPRGSGHVASLDEAPGLARPNRLDPPPPLPGLISEIASYIYGSSPHPVADISMMAAIGLMAGICGRAYNVDGSGLNLYLLLVAPSGTGKDSMAHGIASLLTAAKGGTGNAVSELDMIASVETFVGPNFVSAAAINKHLPQHPSFVTIIPEYGKFLKRIASPKAGPQDVQLVSTLLDLYSRSGAGNIHRAHAYSSRDDSTKDVEAPAVSILGETTGETFYEVLTTEMVNDGFLPRFLVWEYTGPRPYEQQDRVRMPSPQLVTKMRTLLMLALDANAKSRPREVQFDAEARQLHTEFSTFATDQINNAQIDAYRNLWNRAALKLKRLAALGAVSINPYNPIISRDVLLWAKTIVMRDVQSMLNKFDAGETGDQKEQSRNNYVLKLMREFITDRRMHVKYKIKSAYFDAHIVPQSYLSTKTGGHGSFKNVPGFRTSHQVLLATIEVLIARGLIHEVPSDRIPEAIGSKAKALMLDPIAMSD